MVGIVKSDYSVEGWLDMQSAAFACYDGVNSALYKIGVGKDANARKVYWECRAALKSLEATLRPKQKASLIALHDHAVKIERTAKLLNTLLKTLDRCRADGIEYGDVERKLRIAYGRS